MQMLVFIFALTAILLTAALFGFFYAWVCSTMWGLDTADPKVAIAAMQAMNASVRNALFAPAFFGTPFALLIVAGLTWFQRARVSALSFGVAGLIVLTGGIALTGNIHIPMNNALAGTAIPQDARVAAEIWAEYSQPWQVWNQTRTAFVGLALALACYGLWHLPNAKPAG